MVLFTFTFCLLQRMHEILIEELNRQIYVVSSQVSQGLQWGGSARRGELSMKAVQEMGNMHVKSVTSTILFVCFDALQPSQQFFSHVGTINYLPGLNQY